MMPDMGRDDRPLAGQRILFLPRYPSSGPSSRLRMGQFVPSFEAAGAQVTVAPFFDEAYLAAYFGSARKPLKQAAAAHLRRAIRLFSSKPDIAWVEKELFPFLPGGFERALAWRGIDYVVDYDDAIFHNYDRHRHRLVRTLLGRKLDPLLKKSAAVTAGNDYLADYARRHGASDVVRIPTVVDPTRYPVTPPPNGPTLRIGWIGTPSNSRYLAPVIEAMRRLTPRIPMILVTIGAAEIADCPVQQETHAWSEDSEAALLTTIDIGVMPLPDNPFERGKCGYKLIQYMAAARPVIASPVGVNAHIVDASVGLLADGVDQWQAAIAQLADDPGRRIAMGQAGRRLVETQYSIGAVAPRLIDVFAKVSRR